MRIMNKKVSLVLSGGGARGLAHIGVIEELEKHDFQIVSISGASMGAVVGGVYALGKLDEFKKWMFSLDRLKVFNLVDFTFSSQGLVKGDKVFKKMKEFIADENIENLNIPFAAVAVDLINKKEVVFTKGSIYEALRASVAIPTVLTPVKKAHELLVDGGVLNNIPVAHIKRTADDLLVVVNVNADIPVPDSFASKKEDNNNQSVYLKKLKAFYAHLQDNSPFEKEDNMGYFDLMNRVIDLMRDRLAKMTLEDHNPDLLVQISHESCGTFDFYKAEEMVEMGRYTAKKCIEEYKKVSGTN
jgi:NTE family protein